jgi:hypothetical protein
MQVTLEWHEYAMGSEVGKLRMLASIRRGSAHRYGMDRQGWTEHIEGACAELAVAKTLGVYWDGSVDTFKGRPDLPGVEVRWRSRPEWDLIVRPDDDPDAWFVLVVGSCPTYTVVGAMQGRDARRDEWSRDYGGRPPAWFVPQAHLLPIEAMGYGRTTTE